MDSVPPDVKTSSLGSRAPISLASSPRARSTAPSASHPKGWLRLAGCPNFSVKYGSMASSTRGSTGVVDWLSMKIGSFNVIGLGLPSRLSGRGQRRHRNHRVGAKLGQCHAVQHRGDARLDLLH